MASDSERPVIFCDLNAGIFENAFRLTSGSFDDLKRLGISLDQAVGMQFTFNGGADCDELGNPADIMFDGTLIHDATWGYLAVMDEKGVYWCRTNAE